MIGPPLPIRIWTNQKSPPFPAVQIEGGLYAEMWAKQQAGGFGAAATEADAEANGGDRALLLEGGDGSGPAKTAGAVDLRKTAVPAAAGAVAAAHHHHHHH